MLAELVDEAMKEAVAEAIADHHRAGHPVPIWEDGQIMMWYPDGSLRPAEEDEEATTPDAPSADAGASR